MRYRDVHMILIFIITVELRIIVCFIVDTEKWPSH